MVRKCALIVMMLLVFGCGPKKALFDPKTQTDAQIYEMGMDYLKENDYEKAREAFRVVFESFPQSDYRILAKLGQADSYFEEGRQSNLLLAHQEYQDFISLFPFSPKACYAQLRMGLCYFRIAEKPDRDQSNTRTALDEFRKVVDNYPDCEQYREAYDYLIQCYGRLAEHEYLVAFYYSRTGRDVAAVERIKGLLKAYPETVHQAKHYFTLAQALEKLQQFQESCALYNVLLEKWPDSEFAEDVREARTRICKS